MIDLVVPRVSVLFYQQPLAVARLTKSTEAISWRGNEIAAHLSVACNDEREKARIDQNPYWLDIA